MSDSSWLTRARIALAVGLALTVIVLVATLSHAPAEVARTNAVPIEGEFGRVSTAGTLCQGNELLPRGTTAIRFSIEALYGPRASVRVTRAGALLTSGERGSGWNSDSVTVAVAPPRHSVAGVNTCLTLGSSGELSYLYGGRSPRSPLSLSGAKPSLPLGLRIEYLRPGSSSWWSRASSVITRMGYGRIPSGTWIALLVLVAMLAVAACVSCLLAGAPLAMRRIPTAAWVAAVAFVSAACWSVVTPPFQVTDEQAHFAYVKQLAETGQLPEGVEGKPSEEESVALKDLRYLQLRDDPGTLGITTAAEQRRLEADAARTARLPRDGSTFAGVAASQPPLYYALEAIPYRIAYGSNILVRVQLMRLLSALLAGLTALFTYLFVREALPGERWAWTIAGLGVALTPMLGVMSGSVNPESLLYTVSAALFYLLARAFRRGLTVKLLIVIGVTLLVGLLAKLNFVGVIPGCFAGIAVLMARLRRTSKREARRCLALVGLVTAAAVTLASVAGAWHLVNADLSSFSQHGALSAKIDFIWDFYLPHLPGMANDFPGIFTTRQIWFNSYVGLDGSLLTNPSFPAWVYWLALAPTAVIACLCVRGISLRRVALRARASELIVYLLMALGVLMMIAIVSYARFPVAGAEYGKARYLLPMLALLGAALALAARGAGRRWGPAAGVLIVLLMLAHDIFSQLLVVARYYG